MLESFRNNGDICTIIHLNLLTYLPEQNSHPSIWAKRLPISEYLTDDLGLFTFHFAGWHILGPILARLNFFALLLSWVRIFVILFMLVHFDVEFSGEKLSPRPMKTNF